MATAPRGRSSSLTRVLTKVPLLSAAETCETDWGARAKDQAKCAQDLLARLSAEQRVRDDCAVLHDRLLGGDGVGEALHPRLKLLIGRRLAGNEVVACARQSGGAAVLTDIPRCL